MSLSDAEMEKAKRARRGNKLTAKQLSKIRSKAGKASAKSDNHYLPDPSVGGKARQLKDPNSFKNNPEKAREASRIGHAKKEENDKDSVS